MAERNMSMRDALRVALHEEMERDETVFVMGEEVAYWHGTHKVTREFINEYGESRVKDTPISEMAIAGAAIGAAMAGLRPVAEIMTINFAFLAFDAIINHAAKIRYMFDGQFKVPMVVRSATGWGMQATASHSQTPEPIFAHFPGIYVACPSNARDAKGMLKAAIRDDNPVLFTEVIALYPKPAPVPDDPDFIIPIGKSDLKREGDHVTLVAYGRGVEWALQAADQLEKDGVRAAVVDMRWLRPLDMSIVFESFKKTNRCVVVEESLPHFSFGSEIAAQIQDEMFDYMDAPIKRVSALDVPLPFAHDLELMALPNAQKVVDAVKEIL
ncbi:MAG: alpha-ketoacid dehydrogenase subunit beta [Anaerolineae bacterium]|nr:alpha-ketoacid dehydrogenase subunit beta [Anaerolineae bacterium]